MAQTLTLELVLYQTQALAALIQAVIFVYYFRVYQREYLRLWAGSFAALTIYQMLAWLALHMSTGAQGFSATQLLASAGSQIAAYMQIVLVIFGTRAALKPRPIGRGVLSATLLAAALFGIACSLAFAWIPHAVDARLIMRVGLRYAISGGAFLLVAVVLWRHAARAGLGARLASISMAAYGIELLHVLVLLVWQARTGESLAWARYVGVYDLVAQLFIGFGLIIWLLEDERIRAQKADSALRQLRDFDPVTGFPNRRRLLNELPQFLRQSNQHTGVLLLRLDQLETLTGTLGVVAAETVMAEAATRLEQCLQPGWPRPARLSETRMVQVVPRVRSSGSLTTVANDMLAALRVPFYSAGQELSLSASVGIALSPEDAEEAEALITSAEAASQRAHDEGGNRFGFYSSELNTQALTRLGLQGELRRALLRHEIELMYQPVIACDTHRLCGAEALARWLHPQRGLLPPDMFISEMEQLGLIEDLDRFVLEQACAEACQWQQRFGSEITVAVNISTRSFQRDHFPELVRTVLARSGLQPQRLELEVVESSALEDPGRAIVCLTRLRQLGVRVALDDFGTGYSSLTHLRELPVDTLKIDRSFVEDVISNPRDAAIVDATITLSHSLGLDVVVEGVETAEQLTWFQRHGVDRLQGFHFSPPVEREAFRHMLLRRERLLAKAPA